MRIRYHHRTQGRGAAGTHDVSIVTALRALGHHVDVLSPPGVDPFDRASTIPVGKAKTQTRGWRSVHVTDGDHPYMKNWWVPGLAIGYEHSFVHQVADFLEGVAKKKAASPTFRDALETQYICDAVLKSGKTSQWEKVGKSK